MTVGSWIYNKDGMDWGIGAWICSQCGMVNQNIPVDDKSVDPYIFAGSQFCPSCGIRMKRSLWQHTYTFPEDSDLGEDGREALLSAACDLVQDNFLDFSIANTADKQKAITIKLYHI